ncbi:MAG: DNA polymerase I [Wenzhouxiangellaceae bacterium]
MATEDTSPLILVDGSSYLYRAFHALPSLTAGDGRPTGAVFGVANMIRRLIEQYRPRRIAVIFDAPGPNFRHEAYPDYKANRPPMPEELKAQIEPLFDLIDALGVPRISVPGVEADDVIATLVRRAREQGLPVLISSGDKDLAQLVDDDVVLEDTMQQKRYDPAAVEARYGVPPALVGDLLALTGDASDNIPGVEKVGPKTAARWLSEYGSLEGVIEHADQIGGKVGEYLRAALDQLPLSRRLVTLKDDLALDVGLDDLALKAPDRQRLKKLLTELGFHSWLKTMDEPEGDAPADSAGPALHVEVVRTRSALDALVDELGSAGLVAFDTETTSLEPLDADLVGIAFAVRAGHAWYVPLAHADAQSELTAAEALKRLSPLLVSDAPEKVAQNAKYDLNVLQRAGIVLGGLAHDTMLESYCLNATAGRHDLDSLAARYLQRRVTSYSDIAGKGKNQLRFDQIELEQAADYAGEDAEVCLALHQRLWPEIEKIPGVCSVYREIEVPLIEVLARMERTGVLVDRARLEQHSRELTRRLEALERQAWALAGGEFNLGSPKQLQEILFDRLGIPVGRKTPKGQPSTAEDVLADLAREHELPRVILEYRSLAKLKNTYTDSLPKKIRPDTGRVHTHYHQAVAATGRLSSSDPNLQNIPIRTDEGRRIRKAFIAPDGWLLLAADYSQVELRIMAHLSGDERLLEAFARGEDIHRATAAEVFGKRPDEVTADERRSAKAINFGLMYGMSAFGLARQLETDRSTAAEYIERYFERYPGVKRYMDQTRALARRQGYVETLFGRRLWLPEIRSRNRQRQQAAERAAINAPLQGTAADIIKRAMIDVDRWLVEEQLEARLVMQVHDELVLEVRDDVADEVRTGVIQRMSRAANLRVPLVVDAKTGSDWDSAH